MKLFRLTIVVIVAILAVMSLILMRGGALVRIHLVTDGDCRCHCSTGCRATKET